MIDFRQGDQNLRDRDLYFITPRPRPTTITVRPRPRPKSGLETLTSLADNDIMKSYVILGRRRCRT